MSGIDDRIDVGTAAKLLAGEHPIATCQQDGEPLVMTFEFHGAEFFCVVCGAKYGFLAPVPVPWTQELQDRHDELEAKYTAERAERERGTDEGAT